MNTLVVRIPRRSAFTLLELIVVIAVIALLIGTHLVGLSSATDRTQTAQDLSNCRQIMAAMQMYASENLDTLPRPGWGLSVGCWASAPNPPPGPGSATNYSSVHAQQLAYVTNGLLWPYLGNYKLLMCPGDGPGKDPNFYFRRIVVSSYVWNGGIIGYPGSPDSSATRIYKITNARFKPDTVLQWEDNSDVTGFNDFASFPSEGVSPRHGTGATIAMFGGGAERIPISRWYQPNKAGDLGNYDSFACSGGPQGSPGYISPGNNAAPNRAWCSPASLTGH